MIMHFEQLQQLIGGYFHQDWDIEGQSDEEVVFAFVRDNTSETARHVIAEIDDILYGISGLDLDELLNYLGCEYSYQTDGKSAAQWLKRLRNVLANQTIS